MPRDLRIALLTLGVVAGFGSGVHALRHRAWERHRSWERHMAAVCVEAGKSGVAPLAPEEGPDR
jgi:hypothetical protein